MPIIILDVAGNTLPNRAITVQNNSIDIDLSLATAVDLIIYRANSGEITNAGHQSCTIIDADGGQVNYSPQATDLPEEGRYIGEVRVTYSGGSVQVLDDKINIIARDTEA